MRRFRLLMVLAVALALILPVSLPASAADNEYARVGVVIDGNPLKADAFIVNGRTVVPLRAIFDALSATVEWDGATRTVTGTKGTTIVKLTIDNPVGKLNGKDITLAVPPMIIDGRTFVPLRFISEALGYEAKFDTATRTVVISSGSDCTLPGGQKHSGTIGAGGETWTLCGSPHIVSGEFVVEGKDSPVLTIEAGVLVQFESDASFRVGRDAPGGLWIKGAADKPVTLTAAIAGAQAGFWEGIRFYKQTMRDMATIENAKIQYAGGARDFSGAIYMEGADKLVEVLVKDVEIANSQYAGINMWGMSGLREGSKNLKITGTKMADGNGGFPIVTDIFGSNKLPNGTYTGNDLNAVNLFGNAGTVTVSQNTTWRNIGIPYASAVTVNVEGNAAPTLKLEPGVVSLWKQDTALVVGKEGPGTLVADAKTKPEGGGEWTIDKAALDGGLKLATSQIMMPEPACSLCGSNHAIVFGGWTDTGNRGSWNGIQFYNKAGDKSKLIGAVVAYAGKVGNYSGGIYVEGNEGTPVKVLMANSMVAGSPGVGMEFWGDDSAFAAGSTGNYFTQNGMPLRLRPGTLGTLAPGNTYTGNDNDWVSVWSNNWEEAVTKTATWRNQGVPYYFETGVVLAGSSRPVVTIEAGTKLVFITERGITVGSSEGVGSLVAVGAAGKPITFTSEMGRPGSWNGLYFTDKAGQGNRLEYVTIEDAKNGVLIDVDLGAFIKNATIKGSSETGIYRSYGTSGTSFTTGLGNQFQSNASDQNEE